MPILVSGIRHRFTEKKKIFAYNDDDLPKISIIIPTKNEKAVIRRCLNGFLNLTYPKTKMEILIVDGDSKDGTKEICLDFASRYPDLIKIIEQAKPHGKPAALNIGLKNVSGEIVAIFDADSVPNSEALLRAASYFTDSSTVAIQGLTSSINESENMLTQIVSREENAWFKSLIQGKDHLKLFVPLTGSCQFIRREILERLGGWDESCLAEDVDFAARLVEKGYNVKYACDINSYQETPNHFRNLITQRVRWYRGYMEAFMKYGRLLKKPNLHKMDAEFTLMGPYIITLCFVSYILWLFNLFFPTWFGYVTQGSFIAVFLPALALFSLGIALVFLSKPYKIRNILWLPFVYLYWLVQNIIATIAFTQILLHRPKIWNKTIKEGKSDSALGFQ